MSLFARIILALVSALLGTMMIFIAPPTDKAVFFYGFGAFCISIALACFTHGRLAQFFGSLIGFSVFCVGLFFLGHELLGGQIFSGSRSQPSILNACMFMLVFGLPGGLYVLDARFGLRRKERAEAVMFEREVIVQFDDACITSTYPDGTVQSIAWDEIDCVAIETNDSGPCGSDVWWLLEGADKRCVYPQGATGDPEALDEYPKRLPEFRDRAVIEAMGCTSNARFICWERRHAA